MLETKLDDIRTAFNTNTMGPLLLIQQIAPIMRTNKYGRIVNISSGAGNLLGSSYICFNMHRSIVGFEWESSGVQAIKGFLECIDSHSK